MNDKIKNYLGLALIAGVLAVGYAAINFAASYPAYSERTFTVTGEGEVVAKPDVGRFVFSVRTEGGTNVASLQQQNTDSSNLVIEFLKGQGVGEADIQSEGYNVYPNYQYFDCRAEGICPPARISGYTVEHSLKVTIRDLGKAGDLLSGVVENGANTVSQLTLEVDDPTELENEARASAIEQARANAKSIAKASGFRVGKLINVYTIEPDSYPSYKEYDGYGGGAALEFATPQIETGSQKIRVVVNITYEIR
ncbi:MAG: SIMPL domain-containing protein [bacterium]|nr:SIMPL domain-containing protein [bacterium]MDZ4231302.1 SIMPL domain-containing protein [Patescibacteria group bacterium]